MFFELGGHEYSLIKNCAECLNCGSAPFSIFKDETASFCECRRISISGGIGPNASVQGPSHLIKMLWIFRDRAGQTYTWADLMVEAHDPLR